MLLPPTFDDDGVLPPGDYELTLAGLKSSVGAHQDQIEAKP
jgi:hypothetical protein